MKALTFIILSILLTGCIVQPPHKHQKTVKKKVMTVLEKEHHSKSIVVVNVRPAKSRKCWAHNRHWHCHY